MKKFFLGILTVILFQGIVNYANYYLIDNDRLDNMEIYDRYHTITFNTMEYLKLTPLVHVVTGRCRKDLYDTKRKVTIRQWFQCNGVQNTLSDLIYRE